MLLYTNGNSSDPEFLSSLLIHGLSSISPVKKLTASLIVNLERVFKHLKTIPRFTEHRFFSIFTRSFDKESSWIYAILEIIALRGGEPNLDDYENLEIFGKSEIKAIILELNENSKCFHVCYSIFNSLDLG